MIVICADHESGTFVPCTAPVWLVEWQRQKEQPVTAPSAVFGPIGSASQIYLSIRKAPKAITANMITQMRIDPMKDEF